MPPGPRLSPVSREKPFVPHFQLCYNFVKKERRPALRRPPVQKEALMDQKQEQKFHQMTEIPVSRLICRLALPCIISMLVTSFYNMADTFFVGMV